MAECFACGVPIAGRGVVAVPVLNIVVCRDCELKAFRGQISLPRPPYGQTWARQMDAEFSRRVRLDAYSPQLDG